MGLAFIHREPLSFITNIVLIQRLDKYGLDPGQKLEEEEEE